MNRNSRIARRVCSKLLVRLTREADDDVGGHRRLRQDAPDLFDDPAVAVQPVVAVHADQDLVVPGLQRQVHLLGDRPVGGHRLQHLGRHVLRMRGGVVDPDRAAGLLAQTAHAVEQLGEAALARLVGSVGVDVLPEQRDRVVAEADQAAHLVQDARRRPRYLPPAGIGHRAEGAELVAPVLDGHECRVVRGVARGDLPEGVVGAQVAAPRGRRHHPILTDQVGQRRYVGGAHQEVELSGQPLLVMRQHAAGHEGEQGTLRLPGRFQRSMRASTRSMARCRTEQGDRADQIGLFLSLGPHESRGVQHRGDSFGVRQVHLAAERHQMVRHAAAEHNRLPTLTTTDGPLLRRIVLPATASRTLRHRATRLSAVAEHPGPHHADRHRVRRRRAGSHRGRGDSGS